MSIPLRFLPLMLVAASLALHAQNAIPPSPRQQPPAPPRAPQPKGTITGTVYCADTRLPARGAMVIVSILPNAAGNDEGPDTSAITRVGMDGTYTTPNLAPGEYGIIAVFPGYLSPMEDITAEMAGSGRRDFMREIMGRNGTVVLHGGSATLNATLQRGAAVSGRVLYSDGSPASQVSIEVEDTTAKTDGKDYAEGHARLALMRQMFTHQSQNTDDQGRFRISGLKPGTYRVAAVQAGTTSDNAMGEGFEAMSGMMPDAAALRVYSGDTIHKKAAKTYDLRPSDELTGVDIIIPFSIFHRVHGVLTAKDGRPINNAALTLTDNDDASFTFSTKAESDGSFRFLTVPAGTYTLATSAATIQSEANADDSGSFNAPKPTNAFADATTSITIKDSNLDDVTLTLTEVPLPPQPKTPIPNPLAPED